MTTSILVLTAIAAVAVLVGVAFVVTDRDGQLARFEADHPPLDFPTDAPVTSADIAHLRLPLALWGYHVRAVDEVLAHLAASLQERDDRIAELEHGQAEPTTGAGGRENGADTPPTATFDDPVTTPETGAATHNGATPPR